jgi:hypothetical protein
VLRFVLVAHAPIDSHLPVSEEELDLVGGGTAERLRFG